MKTLASISRRRPRLALWLAYTGLFVLLMGVWMAIFVINGKELIAYSDATKQHYIALVYYGRWLRSAARALLHGAAVPTFDFSIGYGADIISTLSYYCIGDPLALLSALVPSAYTEYLLVFLSVLRIYLSGLTFMALSRYHGNGRFGTVLGALAYAFSAWSINSAGIQPIFLIPLYCFPLVLLGADRLFDGRRPTLYIAAIALAALSNFLFFYMIAVLLVCYALVKYFRRYGRQLRALPVLLGKFLVYSMIGIAIAGTTLLPTLLEMFGGVRFGLERQVIWYPFNTVFQALANLTVAEGYDAYCSSIGITAPAVLAVMVLFVQKKRNGHLKLAWLACFAGILIPWCGVALNGFSYMQNRWVWAFALLEAFIFARICPQMAMLDAGERTALAALLGGYCLLTFWNAAARTEWTLLGTALLLLLAGWTAAGPQTRQGTFRAVLLAGCGLGIVLNLGYKFGQNESSLIYEFRAPGEAWKLSVTNNQSTILQTLGDDGFWRYESDFGEFENAPMLTHLHGTGYFWSLHNSYLSHLFAELGQNLPKDYEYRGLMKRAPLEALFGAKYYVTEIGSGPWLPAGVDDTEILAMDVGGIPVRVCENKAALPIGFTVGERLTRAQYDALSPVQRQDALLSAVLLEDDAPAAVPQKTEEISRVQTPEMEVTPDNGLQQLDGHTYYNTRSGGTLTVTVPAAPQNCESYFVVQGMEFTARDANDSLTAGDRAAMAPADRLRTWRDSFFYRPDDHTYLRVVYDGGEGFINYETPLSQYYCGRHDFAYNMGRSSTGITTVKLIFPYAGYYRFDGFSLEYQPVDDIVAYTAPRRDEALQNVVPGTNSLTGEVTVSTDKILVVQVPYSRGWRAYVDGAPAQLLRADTAFLGLMLSPGTHTMELRYTTPGLAAGIAFSLTGAALFILISVFPRLRRRPKTGLQPRSQQV